MKMATLPYAGRYDFSVCSTYWIPFRNKDTDVDAIVYGLIDDPSMCPNV